MRNCGGHPPCNFYPAGSVAAAAAVLVVDIVVVVGVRRIYRFVPSAPSLDLSPFSRGVTPHLYAVITPYCCKHKSLDSQPSILTGVLCYQASNSREIFQLHIEAGRLSVLERGNHTLHCPPVELIERHTPH